MRSFCSKYFLIVFFSLGLLSCSDQEVDPNDGLVAYYPFNQNANDESNNDNNGIVYGAVMTSNKNDSANTAYYFDGIDDYIEVPSFGNISPKNNISISLWIKTDILKSQFQLLLCPDNNRFGIAANYAHNGSNSIFWDYGWDGSGGDAPGRLYTYPEFDTEWHHYVFVSSIEKGYMKIYEDGILLISKNEPQVLLNATGKSLKIGSADNSFFHKGKIDEIRIYNRVISNEEILNLYNL